MTCPICRHRVAGFNTTCRWCGARIVRPEKMLEILKTRQAMDDIMYVDQSGS